MPGVCISCLGCASHLLRLLQVAQVIDGCSQRVKHTACMPCNTHITPQSTCTRPLSRARGCRRTTHGAAGDRLQAFVGAHGVGSTAHAVVVNQRHRHTVTTVQVHDHTTHAVLEVDKRPRLGIREACARKQALRGQPTCPHMRVHCWRRNNLPSTVTISATMSATSPTVGFPLPRGLGGCGVGGASTSPSSGCRYGVLPSRPSIRWRNAFTSWPLLDAAGVPMCSHRDAPAVVHAPRRSTVAAHGAATWRSDGVAERQDIASVRGVHPARACARAASARTADIGCVYTAQRLHVRLLAHEDRRWAVSNGAAGESSEQNVHMNRHLTRFSMF